MNSLIRKELHDEIEDHLSSYLKTCHRAYFCGDDDVIELHINEDKEDSFGRIIIRLCVLDHSTQLQIPNISVPPSWKGNRLGLQMIDKIYKIARKHNYALFITDLTNSFFEYLVKCGALITDADTAEITDDTKLIEPES